MSIATDPRIQAAALIPDTFQRIFGRMLRELACCGADVPPPTSAGALAAYTRVPTTGLAPEDMDLTAPGIAIRIVLESLRAADRPHFRRYMFVLAALLLLRDQRGGGIDVDKLMLRFRALRAETSRPVDVDDEDCSPEMRAMFQGYADTFVKSPQQAELGMEDAMQALTRGCIGGLAKEISQEIMSEEEGGHLSPSDAQSGQLPIDLLGKVMQRVTSKISHKVQSGELRHDQLLNEALGLLSSLGRRTGQPSDGGVEPDALWASLFAQDDAAAAAASPVSMLTSMLGSSAAGATVLPMLDQLIGKSTSRKT
jgi:hypothetical protein